MSYLHRVIVVLPTAHVHTVAAERFKAEVRRRVKAPVEYHVTTLEAVKADMPVLRKDFPAYARVMEKLPFIDSCFTAVKVWEPQAEPDSAGVSKAAYHMEYATMGCGEDPTQGAPAQMLWKLLVDRRAPIPPKENWRYGQYHSL